MSPPINLRARRGAAAPTTPAQPAPKPPKPKPQPKPEQPRPAAVATVQPPPTPKKLKKHRPLKIVPLPALEGPPTRFQLRMRGQAWKPYIKLPEGAVDLLRSGWGCPMRIEGPEEGPWRLVWASERPKPGWFQSIEFGFRRAAQEMCQVAFARWLREPDQADVRARARAELRGKHFGCVCRVGGICHGDVILAVANQEEGSPE